MTAWLLTEEGVVHSVFGGRMANSSDSIWTISVAYSLCRNLLFLIEDQTMFIMQGGNVVYVYHM